ncbi:transmembrane 4 L6 family member 1 isoform X2 [Denticeps clupeoides]|nr:transmembrane 4 L6 family member 1-like isoform X2 [Denticeps clupeoides]
MCVARCSRCVGWALVVLAIVSMLANALLLFPNLEYSFLLERHVTREALFGTGLWASGLLMLLAAHSILSASSKGGCCGFRTAMLRQVAYSCLACAATALCFWVSATGLVHGPLCLHNGTQGLVWDTPLFRRNISEKVYLFDTRRWAGACVEPRGVVLWNVVLFSVLGVTSGLQAVLCAAHVLNALLGMVCGPGFGNNKVVPA